MDGSAGLDGFNRLLPKAELHVHIEGTLEPELMFEMAQRNGNSTRHATVEDLRAAYKFSNLQEFLDIYYEGAAVLQTEQDFYDLTLAYLRRVAADGVRRAEIFFDPQTHTERGIPFGLVIEGIHAATVTGERELGVSGGLIMCFLRHLPPSAAMRTLEMSLPYRDQLIGVGLDSSEVGFPPELFVDVFARAGAEDFHRVAHAGEEGPPEYVWSALDSLGVERIDHGVRSLDDPALVKRLATDRIPLTVCPFSNIKLGGFATLAQHPLPEMLAAGLNVSINSDDPAYFGGYVGDNYIATQKALDLTREQMINIATNSISATFLPSTEKEQLQAELTRYVETAPL
ncbi:MAG: adenosine deaminase [Actinomycetota bacterium]|nr:adenosine deaminase [Actinomycetota bacterium]